jgi:site-specific DNA recombinase
VRDVTIRSATEPISDDATGKFIQTVLSGIAELDNDVRGQRAKDGMLRVVEKGGWPHKAPLGYVTGRDDQDQPILVEHPKQGPMLRQMFALAVSGKHTLTQIRAIMEQKGWESVFGSKPILQIVDRMLRKPIHGGSITGSLTGGKPIDARFKGIVDKATFYRVQAILDGKGHVIESRKRDNPDFPLRRFMSCGHCGKVLTASFSTGRNGRYGYYRCANPVCRKVNVPKDDMEDGFRAGRN